MKVALVYDRVNKWGGAERVLLALHKLFPKAPLYTSVYDEKKAPWALRFNSGQAKIKTSFLQSFPFASSSHELYAALMPIAFESFSFDNYDLVISVTSEAAKGIITKPKTVHVCYCLTPTRYLWSGYKDYFMNPYLRFISKPVVYYLRSWDRIAAQRPDVYIAISKEVQGRIKRYYGRESIVIYPPVGINFQKTQKTQIIRTSDTSEYQKVRQSDLSDSLTIRPSEFSEYSGSYFLIVSRLVPYKRIDLAVKAFNKLKFLLKIVGIGSEYKKLRSIAKPNIEFLGYLTEGELVRYYRDCRALVFPGIEDFGLTILEAQSFGKSVIAFRNGGALETIIEGKTGEFFYPQTEEALVKKIKEFKNSQYDPSECIKNVKKFSYERFRKEFMDIINTISKLKAKNSKLQRKAKSE